MTTIYRITIKDNYKDRIGYFIVPGHVTPTGLWEYIGGEWPTFAELARALAPSWKMVFSIPERAEVFSTHDYEEEVCSYMIGFVPFCYVVYVNGHNSGNWMHGADREECEKSFFEAYPSLTPYRHQILFHKMFGVNHEQFSVRRVAEHLLLVRARIVMADGTETNNKCWNVSCALDCVREPGVKHAEIDVLPGGELLLDGM